MLAKSQALNMPASGICINKQGPKAFRKLVFDMCDKKNKDKVKLSPTFQNL